MIHDHSILLATNISQFTFESDDFPFPQVGYVFSFPGGYLPPRFGKSTLDIYAQKHFLELGISKGTVFLSTTWRWNLEGFIFSSTSGWILRSLGCQERFMILLFFLSLLMFHTPENEHVLLRRGQFQKGAEHHLSSHYFLGNMSNIFRIFVGNMLLFLWPQWRLQCDLKVTESKRQTRDDCSDSQASWAPLDLGSPPSCRWFYDFMNQVVDKSYWMVVTSRTTTLYGYDTILVLWVRTMQPFSFFSRSCL